MSTQFYYGHGKLLLTGEYVVLDGAKALAVPCKQGQKLSISHRPSNNPKLIWNSYDSDNNNWFSAEFELWHFNILKGEGEIATALQSILKQARAQNIHFLREESDVHVTTNLEFPVSWGLGSSSTLIYNIAQWAYVSPFELLQKTFGGSGYDICCAQSMGPITYQLKSRGPAWELITFDPSFKDQLYFVHLNKKQNSQKEVSNYKEVEVSNKDYIVKKISLLTQQIIDCTELASFEELIKEHEDIISKVINRETVKKQLFSDYWGEVKSLGAWGGDFVLVTSNKSVEETQKYFNEKGFETFYAYDDLVLKSPTYKVEMPSIKVSENVVEQSI